jgi:hypothetical protein
MNHSNPIGRRADSTPALSPSVSIALALGAALLAACASSNNGSGGEELTGTASIAITNAPADGTCIEITAAGYRTVTQNFSVAAGASTVLAMKALPLGAVTFSANAFSGSCSMVNPMSVPNWVSNQVPASVAVAPAVSVALEMQRNGNAQVSVDFPNEPDGSSSQPPMCMAPQVQCGGVCTNPTNDPNNCGMCGAVCAMTPNATSACVAGACSIACNAGFANCDNNIANGCESNVAVDINNCGGCGVRCFAPNGTDACMNGVCVLAACNVGFANCDGNLANGCEANISTSSTNCGGCGIVCPAAHPTCASGTCM